MISNDVWPIFGVNTSRRNPHVGSCVFLARQGTPMTDPSAHCQPVPWWKHLHPCICHRTSWFAWTSPRCETLREPPFEVIQVLLGCQSPKGPVYVRWSKSALGVSCCFGFRLTTIRPGSYFWPKSNASLRHSSNGENGNLGSCSSHPAHPSHAAQLSAPNRKRGAQGAPSRYPPVPLCPRSAPSSPPSAAPCQTSARNLGFRRGVKVMVEPRGS